MTMMVSTGTSSKSGFEFTFQSGCAQERACKQRITASQVSGLPHESHPVMS